MEKRFIREYKQNDKDILFPILEKSKFGIMLIEEKENKYKLIDIKGITTKKITYTTINDFLRENDIKPIFPNSEYEINEENWISHFVKIPNTQYIVYTFKSYKKRSICDNCGYERKKGFLLVANTNGWYNYVCENCFFESFGIEIPEKFKKDYNYLYYMDNARNSPKVKNEIMDISHISISCEKYFYKELSFEEKRKSLYYKFKFGKHKGKKLIDVYYSERSYIEWAEREIENNDELLTNIKIMKEYIMDEEKKQAEIERDKILSKL